MASENKFAGSRGINVSRDNPRNVSDIENLATGYPVVSQDASSRTVLTRESHFHQLCDSGPKIPKDVSNQKPIGNRRSMGMTLKLGNSSCRRYNNILSSPAADDVVVFAGMEAHLPPRECHATNNWCISWHVHFRVLQWFVTFEGQTAGGCPWSSIPNWSNQTQHELRISLACYGRNSLKLSNYAKEILLKRAQKVNYFTCGWWCSIQINPSGTLRAKQSKDTSERILSGPGDSMVAEPRWEARNDRNIIEAFKWGCGEQRHLEWLGDSWLYKKKLWKSRGRKNYENSRRLNKNVLFDLQADKEGD